jgi:hypothetical protein
LYIDQLNQDYDNPILERIDCVILKREGFADRAKELSCRQHIETTNDKDVFFILFSLLLQVV